MFNSWIPSSIPETTTPYLLSPIENDFASAAPSSAVYPETPSVFAVTATMFVGLFRLINWIPSSSYDATSAKFVPFASWNTDTAFAPSSSLNPFTPSVSASLDVVP